MREYDLSRLKVLAVDRSRNMRSLLRVILSELGMTKAVFASNFEEAEELLARGDIDLLLTEFKFAHAADGLALVDWVRKNPSSPDPYIPILILTGCAEEDHVRAARDAGINDFLVKPVSVQTVYRHVAWLVEGEGARPFIRVGEYLGPDRRRRSVAVRRDRRKAQPLVERLRTIQIAVETDPYAAVGAG